MPLAPIPDILIEPLVRAALLEDLGRAGDITSSALVPEQSRAQAVLRARKKGILAGLDAARLAFRLMDTDTVFTSRATDGQTVSEGEDIATVSGNARAILAAERVALNFASHLSGVASATRRLVDAAKPYKARICCTRKTTPGLRALEKHAVRAGGGMNHRMGLDDAILIKDNHIAVCGNIASAVLAARTSAGHMVKIELEIDTLDQLEEALSLPIDAVLLDNMTPTVLARAVTLVAGRFITEASGNVTETSVSAIAATGVDLISSGAITHSAPILDIGLDFT